MKLLLIIATFLTTFNLYAYVPTVESLFRNGANAEIENDAIVANFTIKKMASANNVAAASGVLNKDGSEVKTFVEANLKLLYTINPKNKRINLVQVGYSNPDMKYASIRELKIFKKFNQFPLQKGVDATEKGLFYSLINSLLLNDGAMMIQFLRSRGVSIRYNKELINKSKTKLLGKYKDYLRFTKGKKDTEIESPLAPSNDEERVKVRTIIKEPFFKETPIVKRIKNKDKFFWQVETDNFTATFSNEKRHLETFQLQTTWGNILVHCKDYILFNGVHEFPKYIYYKDLKGTYYQIQLLSMKHFNNKNKNVRRNINKYQESLKENRKEPTMDVFLKPSFIL